MVHLTTRACVQLPIVEAVLDLDSVCIKKNMNIKTQCSRYRYQTHLVHCAFKTASFGQLAPGVGKAMLQTHAQLIDLYKQ